MTIPELSIAQVGPTARNVQETSGDADSVPELWLPNWVQQAAERLQVPLPDAITAMQDLLCRLDLQVQEGTLTDATHTLDRLRLFWAGVQAGAAMAEGQAA